MDKAEELTKELVNILGQLRAFYLKNHAEPPIAIVLDDRNAQDLMRALSGPNTALWGSENPSCMGIKFRFERPTP